MYARALDVADAELRYLMPCILFASMWIKLIAIGVGISWGITNVFMQKGVSETVTHTPPRRIAAVVGNHWAQVISAPTYVLAQLVNWGASAVLVLSLKGAALHSATPLANAVTVIVTAIMSSFLLRNELKMHWLIPGVVLTSVGAALIAY